MCSLNKLTIFVWVSFTTMSIKETNIEKEWSRVILRFLQKLSSKVFHVGDIAATLQEATVLLSV